MYLSKSMYAKGYQCPKILWMRAHMPEQYDPGVEDTFHMNAGNDAGDMAMAFYGPFVEVPYDDDKNFMLEETKRLMDAGERTICEASFSYEGRFCSVDILRIEDDGVLVTEVKSTNSVKKKHIVDVSYQCWVLEQCGFNVKKAYLLHLNGKYVRHGDVDLHALFVEEDVTAKMRKEMKVVPEKLAEIEEVVASETEPFVDVLCKKCLDDDEPCGYQNWCLRTTFHPSVLDIGFGWWASVQADFWNAGIRTLEELREREEKGPEKIPRFSDMASFQLKMLLSGESSFVDKEKLRGFLDALSYPLYYLDFETINPWYPPFDGTWPYRQIPTQYSLHIQREPGGPLEHREFLAEVGVSPMRPLAERLCADIPADGSVIVYSLFEGQIISKLAGDCPDLADRLMAINDSLVDLAIPFESGYYYEVAQGGSYSIKDVLPALFPDDPELDYHALEGVHNGDEAIKAYLKMMESTPEEQAVIREHLLRYCELDTYAMVEILERLYEVAK